MLERLVADLAWKLLLARDFPSWGWAIDRGATTIWERWDSVLPDGGFQDPAGRARLDRAADHGGGLDHRSPITERRPLFSVVSGRWRFACRAY